MRELLEPYLEQPLAADQYEMLREYLELLLKWNARTNLTAIRDEELMAQRHFGESLALAEFVLEHGELATAADLGSGAGFPGLPFAIFAPEIKVTLVESQNKKATFLKEVVRALDLQNVSVRNERGEQIKERFDVVMMRAVEKFEDALKVAAALVKPKGCIALLISEQQLEHATRSLPVAGLWSTRDLANGAVVAVAKLL